MVLSYLTDHWWSAHTRLLKSNWSLGTWKRFCGLFCSHRVCTCCSYETTNRLNRILIHQYKKFWRNLHATIIIYHQLVNNDLIFPIFLMSYYALCVLYPHLLQVSRLWTQGRVLHEWIRLDAKLPRLLPQTQLPGPGWNCSARLGRPLDVWTTVTNSFSKIC